MLKKRGYKKPASDLAGDYQLWEVIVNGSEVLKYSSVAQQSENAQKMVKWVALLFAIMTSVGSLYKGEL